MSNEKPPMPPQPVTVAIEKPPAWAIALAEAQSAGFANVNEKVDTLATNVEVLQHDAKDTRLRLGRMEREVDEVKGREGDRSMRIRAESSTNLEQDAALAQVIIKVGTIESKVDTHGVALAANTAALAANTATTDEVKKAVTGWLREHPTIGIAIAGLIMTAITWAQSWLTAKGHP